MNPTLFPDLLAERVAMYYLLDRDFDKLPVLKWANERFAATLTPQPQQFHFMVRKSEFKAFAVIFKAK